MLNFDFYSENIVNKFDNFAKYRTLSIKPTKYTSFYDAYFMP